MDHDKLVAVVLAAGRGKRMNSDIQKQYMELAGKPVLYYSLHAFEKSRVDEIILVVGKGEVSYCQKRFIDQYGFQKISTIIEGGEERFESVYLALCAVKQADYVLIHDGARPFITEKIINDSICAVKRYQACVVGMPVKDTIKIVDENQNAVDTPPRNLLWQVQTPQSFSYPLLREAYEKLIQSGNQNATDDAMVVETYQGNAVKLILGSYKNIKITTPEDMLIAEAFLKDTSLM